MRIGVDATCWANGRGYGRFTRQLLPAMAQQAPERRVPLLSGPRRPSSDSTCRDPMSTRSWWSREPRRPWRRRPMAIAPRPTCCASLERSGGRDPTFSSSPRSTPTSRFLRVSPRWSRCTMPSRSAFPSSPFPLRVPGFSGSSRLGWRCVRPGWCSRFRISRPGRLPRYSTSRRNGFGSRARLRHRSSDPPNRARTSRLPPSGPECLREHGGSCTLAGSTPTRTWMPWSGRTRRWCVTPVRPLLIFCWWAPSTRTYFTATRRRSAAPSPRPGPMRWCTGPALFPTASCVICTAGQWPSYSRPPMRGMDLPAVEAAACGTPVIATTSSPLPELLEGGGIFVRPGDEAALVAAFRTMLCDERGPRQHGPPGSGACEPAFLGPWGSDNARRLA